jgi:MFS family permease
MVDLPDTKELSLADTGTKRRFYYGYIIVLVSLLTLLIEGGLVSSYGIFLKQIQNETSWSRAIIAGASSLGFFVMGVFAIFSGKLVDKYGPRIVMTFSGVILVAGLILTSLASEIWQLYLAYGVVVGISISSAEVVTLSMVARWFTKRRGFMTSIIKIGNGLGMFIIPLLASWLILKSNWHTAYVILGAIAGIVVIFVGQFMKKDPSVLGMQSYGAVSKTSGNQSLNDRAFTAGQLLRNSSFWLVSGVYFFAWYATQSVIIHVAVHLQDNQMTVSQAAGILSIIGAVSIAGRLAMGIVGDRIGNRIALVICCSIIFLSSIWLQFVFGGWKAYIFAVVYGFAHGGFFAILSPLVAELFGLRSHGSNLGMLIFIGQTGGAIGPIISGQLYDTTQSYQLAFYLVLGFAFLSLIASILLMRRNKPDLLAPQALRS